MSIDFEGADSTYPDWLFSNFLSAQTNSNVTAHGGSKFGTTGGKTSGYVATAAKVNPSSITFYYSKTSTNTTASTWYVQVSENGTNWTTVGEGASASSGVTRGTWYEMTRDLSDYSNVYVRVYYDGSTAVRCLDDLVLTTADGGTSTKCATPTFSVNEGTFYDSSIEVELACTTTDAAIHYTLDGSAPTASSATYSSAIEVSATTTIKAIAVKQGLTDSDVASATYTKGEGISGYNIDFESNLVAYVDWNFVNLIKTDETISAHGGSYFAKTNGTNTASITTKDKIAYPGTLTYYISKIGTNTNANSKWKARVSSDGTNWTVVGTEYAAGAGVTAGTWNTCTADLTDYSNVYVQVYYDGTTAVRTIDDISLTMVTPGTVATPSISGETPFTTTTTVTLGCSTEGAAIYYTIDGTNPSSSSTLYSSPFELNASATVKAIAIKGVGSSSIASKDFTKVVSYTTLAAIYAKAVEVGETATDIYVTFNSWKISAKNSNNAFLTDGTNGAVIYGSGHGFNAGDELTGTAACKVQLYKGFAELTALNKSTTGLTVTAGTVGDPVVKTWNQLSAVNTGALVKLENLTYNGTALSDGVNTIPTYTTFYTASFETGKSYNLSGVYQFYNTAGQILPRSAADVDLIIDTYTVTYNNAPNHGTLTIKNGNDVVASGTALNEGTVLTIVATPAQGYKLTEITVNGSAYSESTLTLTENVTIAASFEENLAPLVTSYVLSEIGVETSHLNSERVGDKVNLPLTATECSKTFVGWSENANCAVAPEYAPGAEYTLKANNKLYAVYADPVAGSTWDIATSVKAGDVVVISTNTGYTAHDLKTAGAISSSIFGCTASTYNDNKSQITALAEGTMQFTIGGNATNGWTLKSGDKYLKVSAAKKVALVDDAETWSISFSGNNATLAPATGDLTAYSIQYNYNTGNDRFTAYNTAQVAISLFKQAVSYENYSTECEAAETPTSGNVVILAEYNSKYYAMSTTITNETAGAIEVEYDGTNITVNSNTDKAAIQWKRTVDGENTTFQTANNMYLKGTSGGGTLALNANVCNWSWDETNNCFVTGTRGFIYRVSVNGFKNYAVSNLSNADYIAPQVIAIDPANIVITSKVDPALAYTPASATITVGGAWSAPELTYANGFDGLAAVTYASDKEAVATVSDAGVIALAGGTGTAVITASFAGNASYRSGAATYTITVNEAGDDLSGTWALVTDEGQLAAGKKVVIAFTGVENENLVAKTMGAQNSSNRAAVASSVESVNGTYILTPAEGTKVFTLVNAGDGKYAFQATNNNYLYASSNSSNQLKETDVYTNNDNAKWAISFADGGLATIDAQGSNSRKRMRYNPNNNSPLFACYATDATTGSLVTVYMLQEETPVEPDYEEVDRPGIVANNYYTICMPKNIIAVRGATFWTLDYRNESGTQVYLVEATAPFAAGKPYIFSTSGATLEVAYGDDEVTEPVANGALRGTFDELLQSGLDAASAANGDSRIYMIVNNELRQVAGRSGNKLPANRAYVVFDALQVGQPQPAPGRQVRSVPMQGNVATDIDALNTNTSEPQKVLINGQLFILRSGRTYDTTGRQVNNVQR